MLRVEACIAFLLLGSMGAETDPAVGQRALLSPRSSEFELDSASSASGTIYVVRHADTNGAVSPYGINAKGLRRAAYMTTIFDGNTFLAPASIIAASVPGKRQRMVDTVAPLAEHLGITMDTSITLLDNSDWSEQPCKDAAKKAMAALSKGPVIIAWWSYIKYLCKDLGQKCPGGVSDFKGNDQVLVVTVEKGDVKSMTMEKENFVDPGPSPSPSPSPTPAPAPTPSQSDADSLLAGASLQSGEQLTSKSGNARLVMQSSDGNLVLYNGDDAVWNSGTSGNAGSHLVFQSSDGNLVLRNSNREALWSSKAHSGASKAVIYDDCRFEVSDISGDVLWSLGSSCDSQVMALV